MPQHRFLWGVATAAHQVEGGLMNNDWAYFTTTPAIIARVMVPGLSTCKPPSLCSIFTSGHGYRLASHLSMPLMTLFLC